VQELEVNANALILTGLPCVRKRFSSVKDIASDVVDELSQLRDVTKSFLNQGRRTRFLHLAHLALELSQILKALFPLLRSNEGIRNDCGPFLILFDTR